MPASRYRRYPLNETFPHSGIWRRRTQFGIETSKLSPNSDEMEYVAACWKRGYNHYRPHGSLDCKAPATFAAMCLEYGSGSLRLTQDEESCCEALS
jgi:hypothetical protein